MREASRTHRPVMCCQRQDVLIERPAASAHALCVLCSHRHLPALLDKVQLHIAFDSAHCQHITAVGPSQHGDLLGLHAPQPELSTLAAEAPKLLCTDNTSMQLLSLLPWELFVAAAASTMLCDLPACLEVCLPLLQLLGGCSPGVDEAAPCWKHRERFPACIPLQCTAACASINPIASERGADRQGVPATYL